MSTQTLDLPPSTAFRIKIGQAGRRDSSAPATQDKANQCPAPAGCTRTRFVRIESLALAADAPLVARTIHRGIQRPVRFRSGAPANAATDE